MKKSIFLAYLALFIAFIPPYLDMKSGQQQDSTSPRESPALASSQLSTPAPEQLSEQQEQAQPTEPPATETPAPTETAEESPQTIVYLHQGQTVESSLEEYLWGVLAAEMPASFQEEALKAQAVAARTFTIYCMESGKHEDADVCTDFSCCQAWVDREQMKEKWGENYEAYADKITKALEDTKGQYLSYQGQAIFAAFHSSSPGATADCGQVWNPLPYLVSVSSPETAEDVPNFVSRLDCAPLDFRDSILSQWPQADFSGEESQWIGSINRDDSGRVTTAVLGGVEISGTELRSLFSLRSTAFQLEYVDGRFIFTVSGNGHGVGMSQYGAQVMAQNGSDYTQILAHYYTDTQLIG